MTSWEGTGAKGCKFIFNLVHVTICPPWNLWCEQSRCLNWLAKRNVLQHVDLGLNIAITMLLHSLWKAKQNSITNAKEMCKVINLKKCKMGDRAGLRLQPTCAKQYVQRACITLENIWGFRVYFILEVVSELAHLQMQFAYYFEPPTLHLT